MSNEASRIYIEAQRKEMITIMIADDHPLVRQALKTLMENQSDFKLVGEVDNGEEAVNLATRLRPDVVIMDITMPKMNGLEATREIKARCPGIKVLTLTVHNDSEHILGILEAGAAGYLTKSVFGEEVITAIRAVMAGESVLSSSALQEILKSVLRYPSKPPVAYTGLRLTSRELEILKNMENKSNILIEEVQYSIIVQSGSNKNARAAI